ncbi:hypothetical protein [Bradyrhizobium sp. 153]|uniref:hypothetical protein n=1 Tax=Bradyrhizobium sp. 153 TaxID=2782627 RepID=UPI001FF9FFDC|nr:hypothetical protein [Bradyrhizobium sp. 153]MCK1664294.1 hypothetical protein [Bradyrhizobium sp. 153]
MPASFGNQNSLLDQLFGFAEPVPGAQHRLLKEQSTELIIFVVLVTKLPCSALASGQACVDYGLLRTLA